jgi:hypothetical protein
VPTCKCADGQLVTFAPWSSSPRSGGLTVQRNVGHCGWMVHNFRWYAFDYCRYTFVSIIVSFSIFAWLFYKMAITSDPLRKAVL